MQRVTLHPTLWRTCRALMNDVRLRLLWAVVSNSDQLNVTGISRLLDIPQPVATNGLRALQSRGLIGVRRERYSVYYNLDEDQSLPEATKIRNAFVTYFESGELSPDWTEKIKIILKAFTHFNRLAMMRRLAEGEASKADLEKVAGVVVKTLEHHLHLLSRAGFLERHLLNSSGAAVYRLVLPDNPIARELLRQTLGGDYDYFNCGTGSEKNLRLIHNQSGEKGFVRKRNIPIFE